MTAAAARLVPEQWGDSSVLLTAQGEDAAERGAAALRLHRALHAAAPTGVVDWIHSFESVLVVYDCTVVAGRDVVDAVELLGRAVGVVDGVPRRFVVPIRFGGDAGPDLADAARETGLAEQDLIDHLTSGDLVIGAVGGSTVPLMQRHGQPFAVRRMASPRALVPAGSLGLAGDRTCIYPVDAPGGWRLVGRTPLVLPDLDADPVVPYRAGDLVRLRAVSAAEADLLAGRRLRAEAAT